MAVGKALLPLSVWLCPRSLVLHPLGLYELVQLPLHLGEVVGLSCNRYDLVLCLLVLTREGGPVCVGRGSDCTKCGSVGLHFPMK